MSRLTRVELSKLPTKPRGGGDQIRRSWNRLVATHGVVSALFTTLNDLRAAQSDMRGAISEAHRDQARAAIVFTAAGIDACLTALLEDALPVLLLDEGPAHSAFVAHMRKDRLEGKVTEATKRAIVDIHPRIALIKLYVNDLTGQSIQGATDLARCRNALGLQKDPNLEQDVLDAHQPFFNARHEVVHELDIVDAAGKGTRSRRHRDITTVGEQCNGALQLLHSFIAPTARAIRHANQPIVVTLET